MYRIIGLLLEHHILTEIYQYASALSTCPCLGINTFNPEENHRF